MAIIDFRDWQENQVQKKKNGPVLLGGKIVEEEEEIMKKCQWCYEKEAIMKTDEGEFCSDFCAQELLFAIIRINLINLENMTKRLLNEKTI